MRALSLHMVPVWEECDGQRTLGTYPRYDHPPVVGWANIACIKIYGEARWFLLTVSCVKK